MTEENLVLEHLAGAEITPEGFFHYYSNGDVERSDYRASA